MEDQLFNGGQMEHFKAGVHLGLFGLAVMCLGYNAMAWAQRRERHLLQNIVVYGGLAAYEAEQILRHLE